MHTVKTIRAFFAVSLLVITINLNAQSSYQTTSDSRIRSGPNVKYKSLGVIKNGEKVNVIEKTNSSWFKIEYNGKTGFVSSKLLIPIVETPKVEETAKTENKKAKSNSTLFYVIGAIVVVALIFIVTSNNKKKQANNTQTFNQTNNKIKIEKEQKEELIKTILKSIKIEVATSNSNNSTKDESIIDVTGNAYNLGNEDSELLKYAKGVPVWKHQYVYSSSEINSATSEQINFYNYFKYCFQKGQYFDLEGNTNYAFILLFDLINDYENHKNILQVERQLEELGQHYPKTKPYALSSLIKKLEQIGDSEAITKLKNQQSSPFNYQQQQYSYSSYDPTEYRLGNQYKVKLNLSNAEISWLNKFWNPSNVFLGIEGCCIETIRLYLATIKELNQQLKKKESTIAKEVEFFQEEIQKFYQANNTSYLEGYDNSYLKERSESEVFSTIFKRAENTVRETFGHKRKISGDFPYSNQPLIQEFENRIGLMVNQIIQSLSSSIAPPDEKTEEELNNQNVNRWKIKFEQLEKPFTETNTKEFINGIYALEKVNQKNPSIENIFLEASKYISKFDKEESLKFYIYYLYYDLKSDRLDNKQLTKTIQKNLFKTNEQLNDFGKVVAELVKTKDLKTAIDEVAKIYQPKRKKIQLDISAIKEVQQEDQETVELLNLYLKDEFGDENTTVKTQQINNEEIELQIATKKDDKKQSQFINEISLNEIQSNAIALFAEKAFCIPFNEIDNYCKSKGVFKNQLVDSINESCYEVLDDVLIEEDGNSYILNENYYKKISAQ